MANVEIFCSCAPEITDLMTLEAASLGTARLRETRGGIEGVAGIETAYRLCLWSRLANKVYLVLARGSVATPDDLYELTRTIPWFEHFNPDVTFAVFATMTATDLCPPNFASLRVKDAIADQFRDHAGRRPSVDTKRPDISIHLHVQRKEAVLSLDLAGESLHRRGYRLAGTEAMLKETVAASLLVRGGWPDLAAAGAPFIDPMCGAGTLPIEAAFIAGDRAPGLERRFGFERWLGHDASLFDRLRREARARQKEGMRRLPPIAAYDIDPAAIRASQQNAGRAGLGTSITFRVRAIAELAPEPEMTRSGFVAIDPPYGVRTAAAGNLPNLYRSIGDAVKSALPGWSGVLLCADAELSKSSGLWAKKMNVLHNGAIKCTVASFEIRPRRTEQEPATTVAGSTATTSAIASVVADLIDPPPSSPSTLPDDETSAEYRTIFTNRIRKNLKSLAKWSRTNGVSCYRVYDADVPEFSVAIDLYESTWALVQEYAPPNSVVPERAALRLGIIMETLPEVLGIPAEHIYLKERRHQRKGEQYERSGSSGTFYEIREGGLRFLVNLSDYLDSGIFLDHRIMRERIRNEAAGKRFLNLFSYTGSVSVYAAAGGAASTTSVDLSNTYTEWARGNFELNSLFDERHSFIRSEVRSWLSSTKEEYDLIFLDPPTFSRSKSFDGTFQVQRDHPELIGSALRRLAEGGVFYFSTNFRKFELEYDAFSRYEVTDITEETIPFDFRRNHRIHRAFRFTHKSVTSS